MDIGNEISHKIRDAIKAKLIDLGAYVDEELPDYIMVMIANKKTTEQMRDDLQLFLAYNTDKFTVWLDAVLLKLESSTVEDSLTTPLVQENTPVPVPIAPQPVKKTRKGKDSKSSKSSKRSGKVKEIAPEEPTQDVTSAAVQEPEPPKVEEEQIRPDDPSQAIITLTPEMGDFDEELNPEPAEVAPAPEKQDKSSEIPPAQETQVSEVAPMQRGRSIESVVVQKTQQHAVVETVPEDSEENRMSDDADEINVTHISTSPMSMIGERGVFTRERGMFTREREMFTRTVQTASTTFKATRKTEIHSRLGIKGQVSQVHHRGDERRRQMLGSVVGQVIDNEDDDDTLPVTKQGLTSVVKPKRRPTLPPSKQANKSLLVRAMSDAQRSTITELERKRSNAVKIVRPSIQNKTITRNLISRAITQATMSEIQTRIQQNPRTRPDRDQLLSKGLVSKSKSSEKIERNLDNNQYISLQSNQQDLDEVEVVSDEQDDIVPTVRHIDVEREFEMEREDDDQRITKIMYADERVVKTTAKVSPVHILKKPTEIVTAPAKSVNNPRFIVTLAGADSMHAPQRKRALKRAWIKAQRPVVRTICNESADSTVLPYKPTNKEALLLTRVDQVEEDEEEYTFESQVVNQGDIRGFSSRVEPDSLSARIETDVPIAASPSKQTPKVDQVSFSLHDSEDEEMDEISPSKKQNLLERCLFWPACKNGDTCTYVHPTTKCVTFPKCKFGDKCLYIHPNCKFDAKCSRSDCPYTHATRKQPANLPSPPVPPPARIQAHRPVPVICKFHPGCKNPTCTFQHPKSCRFGGTCTRPDCAFSHPKVVTGSALKWKKNVQKSSSLLSSIPQHIAL